MGCISSSPQSDYAPDQVLKRTITLTNVTSGLQKKISLRSSSALDHAMSEELLLSKHGVHYTILNTMAVIDVDTCELIGYLDDSHVLHNEANDHVKDIAAKYKLSIRAVL